MILGDELSESVLNDNVLFPFTVTPAAKCSETVAPTALLGQAVRAAAP